MIDINTLPYEEKPIEILNRDRLNLSTQPVDCEPMNSREQSTVAPFLFCCAGLKFSAQNEAFAFESEQSGFNFRRRKTQNILQPSGGDRTGNFHSSAQPFTDRVRSLPILLLGRFRCAQLRIEIGARINRFQHRQTFGANPKLLVVDSQLRRAFVRDELVQQLLRTNAVAFVMNS